MAFAIQGPNSVILNQGESKPVLIQILKGTRPWRNVGLTVSGLPNGVTAEFFPSSGKPNFNSTLTLRSAANSIIGDFKITVTGRDAKDSDSMPIMLTNFSPNIPPVIPPVGPSAPVLSSLSPSSITEDTGAFTLTVNGSGFVSGATVYWAGSSRTTTFVNSGQVTAAILAGDITTPGTASITAINPGSGSSNSLTFTINSAGSFDPVKAFPTAEGFAYDASGWRSASASILFVDNLNNSGSGSLRAALEATGPRYIIFRTSGTINLTGSAITLNSSSQSNFYLAGQTSPGGVQIKTSGNVKEGLLLQNLSDGVVRHMRIRNGGPASVDDYGNNISTNACTKLIFDHCSLQYGTDSEIIIYTGSLNITVQWCLIARTLPPGNSTGSGVHIGGNTTGQNVSFHHNVMAHCHIRNPYIQRCAIADIVNNVFYNWDGNTPCEIGSVQLNESAFVNFVKNHWIAGPNSYDPTDYGLWWLEDWNSTRPSGCGGGATDRGGSRIYSDNNNWGPLCSSGCANDWNNSVKDGDDSRCNSHNPPNAVTEATARVSTRYTAPAITEHATSGLRDFLLATVGAYKPSRDSRDSTDCGNVSAGTGALETSATGGTWPDLATGAPSYPTDTNGDGIPDSYAIAHGFTATSTFALTTAPNGYQWIENYLNELAGDTVQYTP